jgi:hypothetical protein
MLVIFLFMLQVMIRERIKSKKGEMIGINKTTMNKNLRKGIKASRTSTRVNDDSTSRKVPIGTSSIYES